MVMPKSGDLSDSQNFLVKPYERLPFVILFLGAMALGTWGVSFLLSQLALVLEPTDPRYTQDLNSMPSHIALALETTNIRYAALAGLIGGLVTGVLQWIVIRPYAPSKRWIAVTCGGIIISSLIASLKNQAALSFYKQAYGATSNSVIFSFSPWILLGLGALLLRYYAQARILKSYARNSNLWVLVPILSGLVVALHTVPITMAQILNPSASQLPIFLSRLHSIINLGFLIQLLPDLVSAIAFCFLLKKSDVSQEEPFWLQAPDMRGIQQNITMWKKTQQQLVEAPRPAPEIPLEHSLSYLVGLNTQGQVVGYSPCDRLSAEQIAATPLANMVESGGENGEAIAKFKVMFRPLSGLSLLPLIRIGRRKLLIGVYVALLLIGLLPRFIGR
jgi:thiamine transporter ThiT